MAKRPAKHDVTNPAEKAPLTPTGAGLPGRRWARFLLWVRRTKLDGKAELLLALLAVVSALATFLALTRGAAPSEVTDSNLIQILLRANGIILILLAAILCRWFIRLWIARRSDAPGSRLHTRVTGVFIIIAVVPPIVMAIFSALFLEFGLQTWFSEKVRGTLNSSLEVAEAYMAEHRTTIDQDLRSIAFAYSRLTPAQAGDALTLQSVGDSALSTRTLSELMLIEERAGVGQVIVRSNNTLGLATSRLDQDLIDRARGGGMVITFSERDGTIVGITKLSNFFRPTYLYVARDLNPNVIAYLQATRTAVADYATLEGRRSDIQLQFNVVFVIVALLILLAAIWLGLRFSSRMVTPISNLVDAAEQVALGDLSARVPSLHTTDEVGTLSRAFNRMTDQLANQQDALVDANNTLEARRRFLEDVLKGVTAGIIGLDSEMRVYLVNRAAAKQLGVKEEDLTHSTLGDRFPIFLPLIEEAIVDPSDVARQSISLDIEGEQRTLQVRISATRSDKGSIDGYVVTFDDVTDQLADQRTAAWADVARRIAHEIKNPLTPIQLSAERLKRKYQDEVQSDPDVFHRCTETIVRQVGDLRRMVDEFSSFARMPAPLFKDTDLVDIIRQSVFLQEVANSDIRFVTRFEVSAAHLAIDGRLMGQALTNVIKNAAESIEQRIKSSDTDDRGIISVTLEKHDRSMRIVIRDNGVGLPQDHKLRLTEPYVTTRQKGTGLGLAIVKRILEEHGGAVRIADRKSGGARVDLTLNLPALVRRAQKAAVAAE